jgi:GNAT superfamily N-acetyltransferase
VAVHIREGGLDDAASVIALFDEAVEWLAARGQTGQWGTQPFSALEQRVKAVAEWAASGGLRIADDEGGAPVGAIVLGSRPAWVAAADRPERYIEALVTSRAHAREGIGGELVRRAVAETRADGITLLRVDCWAGAPPLVAWYERQGFRRSGTFEVPGWDGRPWHGQVLSLEL